MLSEHQNATAILANAKWLRAVLGANDIWAITGSANLSIRGLKVRPSDIDVFVTRGAADSLVKSCQRECIIDFSSCKTNSINSYYSRVKPLGMSLELMADVSIKAVDGKWRSIDNWRNNTELFETKIGILPLTTLEFERSVHNMLGNLERTAMIDEFKNHAH